ncbi:MAG: TldD/PmbA family protein [Thermoprotei archaeon]|nr:MAG: TldD/PmbA family protein [Thermoprotei archaeon]
MQTNELDIVDLLHRVVEKGLKFGAEYVDIRVENLAGTNMYMHKGVMEASTYARRQGAGIRCLVDGSWGFAAVDTVKEDALLEAVKASLKMARSSAPARRRRVKLAETKVYRDKVEAVAKIKPSDVDPQDKVKLVAEADENIRSYGDIIRDNRVIYSDTLFKKIFVSSEGAEVIIEGFRTYLRVAAVAGEAGTLSPAYEAVGGVKGFELFEGERHIELAKTVAERAIRLLKASLPKGGLSTVVLDNKLLGLIVHEAFGHTAEADLVISGDMLTGKMGESIASELVTIVDDPGPAYANGWTPYDDEGVKARKVVIVEKGVLREFMQSRETAAILGMEPTGNARAQDYRFAPIVRMRNTYMLPGDWNPEEIIAETKEGYYLKGTLGGQADANGEFMFGVQEAWRIENGELKEPYRGVTVSGNAINVLKSVDAVGKDLKIGFPGTCGKGQMAPVDGGGPHIRCKIIVGGRR